MLSNQLQIGGDYQRNGVSTAVFNNHVFFAYTLLGFDNAAGYFQKNRYDAYTLNNITAEKGADGSVAIQFGGCGGKIPNCLPTMPGWNYWVRLYRPGSEILSGSWIFPEAQPVD